MFSIFNHVMKSERDTNSEPRLPVIKARHGPHYKTGQCKTQTAHQGKMQTAD